MMLVSSSTKAVSSLCRNRRSIVSRLAPVNASLSSSSSSSSLLSSLPLSSSLLRSAAFSSSAQGQSPFTITANDNDNNNNDINQQFVSVLKLNMLRDNPGAVKKKRRVGRGIGSSKGKTCGRGHKGQKSRSGGSIPLRFEGGQTPFYKLMPKRGFTNKNHKADMVSINVGKIQDYIDMGRFPNVDASSATSADDTDQPPLPVWTMKDLLDAGLCTASSIKHGMKLLANGKERLRTPFRIEISRASEAAIEAIEAVGGEVTTVHYNTLALRVLLSPHKYYDDDDVLVPKFARPPPKWQPYYTNWNTNRGYLSVQAQARKLFEHRPELYDPFMAVLNKDEDTNINTDTDTTATKDAEK